MGCLCQTGQPTCSGDQAARSEEGKFTPHPVSYVYFLGRQAQSPFPISKDAATKQTLALAAAYQVWEMCRRSSGSRARFQSCQPRPRVTGIDFIEEPPNRARGKAAERGVQGTFLVKDAMTLKDWTERFDNVIDSGLFHVFDDEDRHRYVEALATVLKPNGRLFLLCFSDEEPGTQGPRRVSKKELHDAFAKGWVIESIEPSRYEVRPDLKDLSFSKGGPKAWFAVVRRVS